MRNTNTDMSAKKALNKKLFVIIGVLLVVIIVVVCSLTMCSKDASTQNPGQTQEGDPGYESGPENGATEPDKAGSDEAREGPDHSVTSEAEESGEKNTSEETEKSPAQSNPATESSSRDSEDNPEEGAESKGSSGEDQTGGPSKSTETNESTEENDPSKGTGSAEVRLSKITATPKKSIYPYGYQLVASDLVVTAVYSDGTTKTVTSGYTVTQTGDYLYVTYEGKRSESVRINFEDPAVKSVSITTTADEYKNGYKLTENDLNVVVTYEDDTKATIANGFTVSQTGNKVYVTYEGVKSNTITVKYSEEATEPEVPTLKSVTISAKASEYDEGYQLKNSDLNVKAAYSNGTTKTVTSGYTINQNGTSVYVTYSGVKSNTITITYKAPETQAPVLDHVQISAKASEYDEGYQLTAADLIVKAFYSDNSSKTVTSGYTIRQDGTSVYVTYNGVKSNTITIKYKEVTVTSVSISAKASEYDEGYQLTTEDLTVTVGYSNGTSTQIGSGYTISQTGASVYVTYQGVKSNTITITYKQPVPVVVTSITATTKQESYEIQSTITAADFNVTAYYSDGSSATVSDGVTLLYSFDYEELPFEPIDRLNLAEYVYLYGNAYYMGNGENYTVRISYQGIQSENITVNTHYTYYKGLCTEMLDLVNQARREAGLHELSWDSNAESAVLTRVEELTVLYSHDRPDGGTLWDLYPYAGPENIAIAGGISLTYGVQSTFDAWMTSPGHKAAILAEDSFITGFACAKILDPEKGSFYVMIVSFPPE